MSVGVPPDRYDRNWFSRALDRIQLDIRRRYSRDQNLILSANQLVLTSPNGTLYAITVDNNGTLSTSAL